MNVGNGDCTIVQMPDNTIMMVDVCNARTAPREANSDFTNPLQYLDNLDDLSEIFRYVQTHPDMDHMDGLSDVLNSYSITNFWDTRNTKPRPEEFGYGYREEDWGAYERLRGSSAAKFRLRKVDSIGLNGGTFPYGIYVISPSQPLIDEANRTEDWNLLSYVILVRYGGFKLLLGGDASDAAWEDIHRWVLTDRNARSLISCVAIFRVSHHGAASSYCGSDILDILQPRKVIISKGPSQDDSAYTNYYNWFGSADNLRLSSQGTVIVDYNLQTNRFEVSQTE